MYIILVLSCIVIWVAIYAIYWRTQLYEWLDNKLDFARFRPKKKDDQH